jgi:uncharacterized protein
MTLHLALFICCSYNNSIVVAFDPLKNIANEIKHGISLSLAAEIDWSAVWSEPNARRDYGELREVGYALIGGRLHVVVFTQIGDTMRVISLRKANNREMSRYEQATETDSKYA